VLLLFPVCFSWRPAATPAAANGGDDCNGCGRDGGDCGGHGDDCGEDGGDDCGRDGGERRRLL